MKTDVGAVDVLDAKHDVDGGAQLEVRALLQLVALAAGARVVTGVHGLGFDGGPGRGRGGGPWGWGPGRRGRRRGPHCSRTRR